MASRLVAPDAETQETTWSSHLQPTEPLSSTQPEEQQQPDSIPSTSYTSARSRPGHRPLPSLILPWFPRLFFLPLLFVRKIQPRTGQFTRNDARHPTHISEYERASEFYYDIAAWENELAQRYALSADVEDETGEGGDGCKRKRPTKKDLVGPLLTTGPPS